MSNFSGHTGHNLLLIFIMDTILELRSLVKGEIFDSQMLMFCLREYKKPRDKVTQLIKNGSIIQLKKGIYIFGPSFRKGLISLEIAAAMLVQPSYISREYALFQYGILPERVQIITSMTTRKKKQFNTPIGHFDYLSLNHEKFAVGVLVKQIKDEGGYLFATKEKAIADWIAACPPIKDFKTLQFFLYEESRIDDTSLKSLNKSLLKEIVKVYKNQNVKLLLNL